MKVLAAAVVQVLTLLHSFEWSMADSIFGTQPAPKVDYDQSYTIVASDGSDVVVTPATIRYNYELYNGQNIFTDFMTEQAPGFGFDLAFLALYGVRNINRETQELVSLDEVYVHHAVVSPFGMIGAELLTHSKEIPYMEFPSGYGYMMGKDRYFNVNAHLISNVDLEPIDDSVALARKQCNECYYASGKGSDCTPERTGTFECCGDSPACRFGGEDCFCQTNSPIDTSKTTKYQLQYEVLITKDVEKFQRVESWNLMAPKCSMLHPDDNACTNAHHFQGDAFHTIEGNNVDPETKNKASYLAPDGGVIVWSRPHLHTGGMNATLLINDKVVCASEALYGNNPDSATNAKNEQNHLIHITSCSDIGSGVRFEQGDKFTIESFYYAGEDDEHFKGAGAGGEHKNVMSYSYSMVVFDGRKSLKGDSEGFSNSFDADWYFRAQSPPGTDCTPEYSDTKDWIPDLIHDTLDALDKIRPLFNRKPVGDAELSAFPIREKKQHQHRHHRRNFLLIASGGFLLGMLASNLVAKRSASRRFRPLSSSSSSQVTEATPLKHASV